MPLTKTVKLKVLYSTVSSYIVEKC